MTVAMLSHPVESPIFETIPCYYCGAKSCNEFINAQDDLTGKPGNFRVVTCRECGLVFQNPRVDLGHIKDYYDDEYIAHRKKTDWGILTWFYNYAMAKHDREKDNLVRRYLSVNAKSEILDVG